MKSKILLVNFDFSDQEKIKKYFNIEVDIGYISDCESWTNSKREREYSANFYAPFSIYEYKACFINLTKDPICRYLFKDKAKSLYEEKETINFLKYWYKGKGILVIFFDNSNYFSDSLALTFGIPFVKLSQAKVGDKTHIFKLDDSTPLRKLFKEIQNQIKMPPNKYLEISQPPSDRNATIYSIYENLNDQCLGCYYNARPFYDVIDDPRFILLPIFKNNLEIIIELLKIFAKTYPKILPEIYAADWIESDKYYPKEVHYFAKEIDNVLKSTKEKLDSLMKAKEEAKKKYKFLRDILITSGDELKDSVIKVFSEIWKLDVKDIDATRKTDFREDILIPYDGKNILGEIKGTQSSYPSPTYIIQLLTHLRKSKIPNPIGALILNHDLKKEPAERANAYTNKDEEEALKEIIFIDTRVLFDLSIAILDFGMPIEEARKILFQNGRITFDLNKYIKSKLENETITKK